MRTFKIFCSTILVITFSYPGISYGGLFGPRDYNDCILDGMKGVTSNLAASEIKNACRRKFPDLEQKKRKEENERIQKEKWKKEAENREKFVNSWKKLPNSELINITGTGELKKGGIDVNAFLGLPADPLRGERWSFNAKIINNTNNWKITNLKIMVAPKDKTDKSIETQYCTKDVSSMLNGRRINYIPPNGKGHLLWCAIYTDKHFDFTWSIVEAKGIPID